MAKPTAQGKELWKITLTVQVSVQETARPRRVET
jgi:hypothetical protein